MNRALLWGRELDDPLFRDEAIALLRYEYPDITDRDIEAFFAECSRA